MKLQVRESQYHMLLEFQRRAYSFDWDDNILNMPTHIHLEKMVGNEWIPVDVSTSEFAELRHSIGSNYRLLNDSPNDAFGDFKNHESFLKDTKEAIRKKLFGPSFDKFKEALMYGNDFSIITARGNSPRSLRDGVKLIISLTFSKDEIKFMEDNLKGLTIDEYLNLQDYHPVSSEEFKLTFGNVGDVEKPEIAKTIALENFVKRVVKAAKDLSLDSEYTGISIGFSDDDLGNIEKAEEFIRKELKKTYPEVRFLVYDTSDPNDIKKKRIIIEL